MASRIKLDLDTILQVATEMADTQGIDQVTLASLAKKLRIRPPSLYNHVDGLPGLRKELAIYGLKQLYHSLTDSVIGRSGDEAVHALGEAYVTFAREHPGLYEATLRALKPYDPDIQKVGDQIVDLVVRVLHSYGLANEAALHAVRGLRSLLHGFASLEQRGGFGLPLNLNESFRLLIDTFLAGIHKMKQNAEMFLNE